MTTFLDISSSFGGLLQDEILGKVAILLCSILWPLNFVSQEEKRSVRSVAWEYPSFLSQNVQESLEALDDDSRNFYDSEEDQKLSPWSYFPVLPHDIHEPLGVEEVSGKMERDVHSLDFRPLCKILRQKVELRELYGGNEYEYRPPYYYESICQGPNHRHPNPQANNPNVGCVYPGFSCIQRSQTVYLTRRRLDTTCWESFTRSVPSSCDCMWPVQALGEVAHQYSY